MCDDRIGSGRENHTSFKSIQALHEGVRTGRVKVGNGFQIHVLIKKKNKKQKPFYFLYYN